MIDKEKYLYWINPNSPNFESELVCREMYSRIGHVFNIVQMIEYNLANIMAIEEFERETSKTFTIDNVVKIKKKVEAKFKELSKLTFGRLKQCVEKSKYLKNADEEALEKIVEYRNYLAHNCFKEKLLRNELEKLQDLDNFVKELNDYETMIVDFNDYLLNIFTDNRIKTIILKLPNQALSGSL